MTIPKSYEALAADLASEKILSKTLQGQKEIYMMLADKLKLELDTWKQKACEAEEREAALREELATVDSYWRPELDRATSERAAIQQRLTVAEQRSGLLEGLLEGSLESVRFDLERVESRKAETYLVALIASIESALKPAKEGEGS